MLDNPYKEEARNKIFAGAVPATHPIFERFNPRKREVRQSYVYIIQVCGHYDLIKIGMAKKPKERIRALRQNVPYRLRVLKTFKGGRRAEWTLHKLLSPWIARGEWFRPSKEVLEVIDNIENYVPENVPLYELLPNRKDGLGIPLPSAVW